MIQIDPQVRESVNRAGRVGVLATADRAGRPNAAYFGSPRLKEDGTLVMGLMANRSLKNLEENPQAVFLTLESAPVSSTTPGWRLYLKARDIQKAGPVLDEIRAVVQARAGAEAAQRMKAGVVFEVVEVRSLVDKA